MPGMGQSFPYVLPLRERQTVVLAWHPDHIGGPARSTNIKPIFDAPPPCCYSTLFHARWCACSAWLIGGEVDFRRDVLFFSSIKGGWYSPPRREKRLFLWYLSPLFEFATNIT